MKRVVWILLVWSVGMTACACRQQERAETPAGLCQDSGEPCVVTRTAIPTDVQSDTPAMWFDAEDVRESFFGMGGIPKYKWPIVGPSYDDAANTMQELEKALLNGAIPIGMLFYNGATIEAWGSFPGEPEGMLLRLRGGECVRVLVNDQSMIYAINRRV